MMWRRVRAELEDGKARQNNYHQGLVMILGIDASWLAEGNATALAPR